MTGFWVMLQKEWLEQRRTARLLIVVIVLTFFGLLSPLLARYMIEIFEMIPGVEDIAKVIPPPTFMDAIGQYVKNLQQFSVLLAIFLAMGSVAQEKDKGTVVLVLVKPVARGTFLAAKFFSLGLTFAIGLILAGAAGYYYTFLLFEAPAIGAWLALNGLIWLSAMVYVALTLLASTLVKQQAAAAGLGFGALLLLGGLGAVPTLGEYLPGQLTNWGVLLFQDSAVRYWPALWISMGIILVALLAAWEVFTRQEL